MFMLRSLADVCARGTVRTSSFARGGVAAGENASAYQILRKYSQTSPVLTDAGGLAPESQPKPPKSSGDVHPEEANVGGVAQYHQEKEAGDSLQLQPCGVSMFLQ